MRKSGLRNGQSPTLKVDFVSRRLINNIYFMIHWLKLIMYMDIYNSRCRRTECRRKRYNCTFSSGSEGTSYFASSISTQHNSKIVSSHGKLDLGLHSVWHTAICSSVTLHAWLCAPYKYGRLYIKVGRPDGIIRFLYGRIWWVFHMSISSISS